MAKINTNDLAATLMEKHGMGRLEALRFLEAFVEVIREGVARDRQVKLKNLGTFKVVDVDARESVNVNTGERVVIEGHPKLTFTPETVLKDLINKPFSAFETVVLNEGVTFDEGEAPKAPPTVPEGTSIVEAVEEPKVEEPVVEEPVVEEPVVEEPVVEEPVVEEPVVEEPKVEEPVVEEPVVEEPVVVKEEITEAPAPNKIEEETVEEIVPDDKKEPSPEIALMSKMVEEENTVEDDEHEADNEDDEKYGGRSPWWQWLLVAIAGCVVGFLAGYYVGQRNATLVVESETVEEPTTANGLDSLVANTDSTASQAEQQSTMAAQPADSAQSGAAQQAVATPKADEAEDYLKYEAMDERVRRGAYNIIGTDEIIKAREGDTSQKIARRTLGDGMECYIEVYNGIDGNTVLKEGQEIKMPKLRVKKSARHLFRRR